MPARPTAVVIEASDPQALARFWARALEWPFAGQDPSGTGTAVGPKDPDGIGLLFVPSTRPKAHKNRLHLDLAGDSGDVRRLLALGASRADIGQTAVPWEVLADPEGNELCVLPDADSGDRLAQICLDAADPRVQGPFWATATGWRVVDEGDWGLRLRSADGAGPLLVLGPPAAPKSGTNRLRLAFTAPGEAASAEVNRLLAAGASRVENAMDTVPWQMLADPEGNEFHIRSRRRDPSKS